MIKQKALISFVNYHQEVRPAFVLIWPIDGTSGIGDWDRQGDSEYRRRAKVRFTKEGKRLRGEKQGAAQMGALIDADWDVLGCATRALRSARFFLLFFLHCQRVQVSLHGSSLGVILTEELLENLQRPFIVSTGSRQIPQIHEYETEVV